jgi:hypothetical protein
MDIFHSFTGDRVDTLNSEISLPNPICPNMMAGLMRYPASSLYLRLTQFA